MSQPLVYDETFRAAIAPIRIMEKTADYPYWSVLLTDNNSPLEVFDSEGHSGGGNGWTSIARHVLAESAFDGMAEEMRFDPEAGMFVAYSDNKQAVLLLAQRLKEVHSDEDELRRIIRAIPEAEWSD